MTYPAAWEIFGGKDGSAQQVFIAIPGVKQPVGLIVLEWMDSDVVLDKLDIMTVAYKGSGSFIPRINGLIMSAAAASKKSGWIVGEDIVPSIFYQAHFMNRLDNDTESLYRIWVETPSKDWVIDENAAEQNEESVLPIIGAAVNSVARFKVVPNADLAEEYPDVIVIIDGKEYAGLDILDEPLSFYMDKDHKVIIDWAHGEVYESFRIVVNR